MKTRAILLALIVAAIGVAYLMRSAGPGAAARPAESTPPPPPAVAASEAPSQTLPARNVFQYLDSSTPAPLRAAPPSVQAPRPSAPPATVSPVRLVGVVRRSGQLRAALAIRGDVFVLATGETAEGYTVVSIDEEEGVSLRAPDGSPVHLTPTAE